MAAKKGKERRDEEKMPKEWSLEKLDAELEEMMEQLNLQEANRAPIRSKSKEEKWTMYLLFKQEQIRVTSNTESLSPATIVAELTNKKATPARISEILSLCRIHLNNLPMSWLLEFKSRSGLDALLRVLQSSHENPAHASESIQYEAVRCIAAFMNNKYGLNEVLSSPTAMRVLARTLGSINRKTVTHVLELMAAVCLVQPNGLQLALDAMASLSPNKGGGFRFNPLVRLLKASDKVPLQVAVVQFINAMVTSPEELDMRVHLRNECNAAGFQDLMRTLREVESEDLRLQLDVFEDETQDDYAELIHRFHDLQVDMQDPGECFTLLHQLTTETPAEPYLLSILQHLLLIRDDHLVRPMYFQLIEECVAQIVLHRNGLDPDPRIRFQLDVDHLIEGMCNSEQVTEANAALQEARQQLASERQTHTSAMLQQQTLLEVSIAERDAAIRRHEERIAALTAELAQARAAAAGGGGGGGSGSGVGGGSGTGIGPGGPGGAPAAGGPPPPPPPPPPPLFGAGPPPPPPPPFAMDGSGGPPPPPPPPGGGPPPPPPFPVLGGPPPPPPPPGGAPPPPGMPVFGAPALPPGIAPKKKYKPKIKTRRVNWVAIPPAKVVNTFWASAQEDAFEALVRFGELEERFGAATAPLPGQNTAGQDSAEAEAKAKKELKSVLDPKKAYAVAITLGRLKLSFEDVRDMLLRMDTDHLERPLLESLSKHAPTKEEMTNLVPYRERQAELGKADVFMLTIGDVPLLTQRLEAMLFRLNFREQVDALKPDLYAVITAAEAMRHNTNFHKLLQIVLLVGNYMNASANAQASYGFKLIFLTQLRNTKTSDNKSTLLHYIAEVISERSPELLKLREELNCCSDAAKVVLSNSKAEVAALTKGIDSIKASLALFDKLAPHPNDMFRIDMEKFLRDADGEVGRIVGIEHQMSAKFEEVCKFYGCDSKDTGPEELFGVVATFLAELKVAHEENEKEREKRRREAERRRAEEEAERKKKEKRNRRRTIVIDSEGDQKGVMDELIASLKTGEAFTRAGRKKGGRAVREDLDGSRGPAAEPHVTASNLLDDILIDAQVRHPRQDSNC